MIPYPRLADDQRVARSALNRYLCLIPHRLLNEARKWIDQDRFPPAVVLFSIECLLEHPTHKWTTQYLLGICESQTDRFRQGLSRSHPNTNCGVRYRMRHVGETDWSSWCAPLATFTVRVLVDSEIQISISGDDDYRERSQ